MPTKANMAISHAVRVFGGIRKVIAKHRSMIEGRTNTGRLTPLRSQCAIRIPAIDAATAGTRGRENIEVTGARFRLLVVRQKEEMGIKH